jgi:UDP-N-acetylmuramoylalanine--D-glutamate ligase
MITSFKNKKIGIWGLGVVGRAAVQLLSSQSAHVTVCDKRLLQPQERDFLTSCHANFIEQNNLDNFLHEQDYILPSPGIDTRAYQQYQNKCITELHIFAILCTKPIITVTGSIGKTTVTSLLGQTLNQQKISTLIGGNIGIASFGLLSQQEHANYIVLEVSSFQLEQVRHFAPQLAIWTNFYPNHLDRHTTADEYFKAKYNSIMHQTSAQQALVPLALADKLPPSQSTLSFFSPTNPTQQQFEYYSNHQLFFIQDKKIVVHAAGQQHILVNLEELPLLSFTDNWLIVCAALYLLNALPNHFDNKYQLPEHRLEKVATIQEVTFYNDSKATIPEATLAAVTQFSEKPAHLFLGGLSKGVDRSLLIKQLKDKVHFIYCFGKEAELLLSFCEQEQIPACATDTLDEAFNLCIQQTTAGDIVLFSPSGSSYDLFANYEERGNYFKKLVTSLSS